MAWNRTGTGPMVISWNRRSLLMSTSVTRPTDRPTKCLINPRNSKYFHTAINHPLTREWWLYRTGHVSSTLLKRITRHYQFLCWLPSKLDRKWSILTLPLISCNQQKAEDGLRTWNVYDVRVVRCLLHRGISKKVLQFPRFILVINFFRNWRGESAA